MGEKKKYNTKKHYSEAELTSQQRRNSKDLITFERNRAAPGSFILSIDLSIALHQAPHHQGSPDLDGEPGGTFSPRCIRGSFPHRRRGALWDTTAGKLIVSLAWKMFSSSVTTLSHAMSLRTMCLYMWKITRSQGLAKQEQEAHGTSVPRPWYPHIARAASPGSQAKRLYPRKEGLQRSSQSKPKHLRSWGRGDQAGPSPQVLCYPCVQTEGNPELTRTCKPRVPWSPATAEQLCSAPCTGLQSLIWNS